MLDYSKMYWVKTHKDTRPKWLAIDWRARGLFRLLLTAVGQDGRLELGDDPMAGVAIAVAAPVDEITPFFKMLVERGSIEVEDNTLIIPNFVAAQKSPMSEALRAKRARENRGTVRQVQQIEEPKPVDKPQLPGLDQTSPVRIKPRMSQDMIERRNAILSRGGSVTKRDGSVTERDGCVTGRDGSVTGRDGSVTERDGSVTKRDDGIDVTKRDGSVTKRDGSVTERDECVTERDESVIHKTNVTKRDGSVTKRDDSLPLQPTSRNVTVASRNVTGASRKTTDPSRNVMKPSQRDHKRKEENQNGSSEAVEVSSEHQVSNRPLGNFLLKFFPAQIADPEPDPDPTSQKPWLTRSGQIKGDALRPVFDELEAAHGIQFSRQQRGFILGQIKRELSQFVRVWDRSEVFDAAAHVLDAWMAEQEGGQYMALKATQDSNKKTFGD